MNWEFIDSPAAPGLLNMQTDLALAERSLGGTAFFRLYAWQPWCISLGAGQQFSAVNASLAEADGIDVVQRPTGGRAILHAEEITYAVALRVPPAFSPLMFYREINVALKQGLAAYHPAFAAVELEATQPDFRAVYAAGQGAACFGTSAKSELKYFGKKIAGSAQRKMGDVILQHGSILCGPAHKQIARYVSGTPQARATIAGQLDAGTADIAGVTNAPVNYPRLREALRDAFFEYFPGVGFQRVAAAPRAPLTV